ncbi:glycosyltransferase family 4 protein [Desulfofustis glycolicus]|uniref:Glycosyl transferases group 1 n=1 Tax=Desulfofustis glycolicus DSM 9705 TaxID=1121409 RepID=A0A1M5WIA9_9BACT|nr:glycosyltransferase family 4 protein [Desulfofustis glycolicus]MCB2216836.1 glycosyltransferase family 4 protein [Desulfobulbaceae bacterium]SHH87235.1 Glycosyl transferases group 1 [Desulfofustis glycolicus DSM 9705]
MNKRSILFVTREIVPFHYGGIGTQFQAMARLLSNQGNDITFLTQKHQFFNFDVFSKNYPRCCILFVDELQENAIVNFSPSGGLVSHEKFCYSAAVQNAFDAVNQTGSPDHVIGADFGAELFHCLLKKQTGSYTGTVFTIFVEGSTHDALKAYESGLTGRFASELDDPQNRLTCAMEDACVRFADRTVFPTRLVWEATRERLDLELAETVIPNIVGPDFSNIEATSGYRQKSKTILFIGRLDFHKGADRLLQAFLQRYRHAPAEGTPFLRFVGRDSFCKSYQTSFLEYWLPHIPQHLRGFVDFTGQVEPHQVRRYIAEATLSVFPSRWEVFGIVCLEAMAGGCPVAVAKSTGLAEVVGDEFPNLVVDFSVDSDNVFDLFSSLVHMPPDRYDKLCAAMSKRAAAIVKNGNGLLTRLFEHPVSRRDMSPLNSLILKDLQTCLDAMADIASIVAEDFHTLSRCSNLSEEELNRVLAKKCVQPASKPWKPAVIKSKLAGLLKGWPSNRPS